MSTQTTVSTTSKWLGVQDFLKALAVAAFSAPLTAVLTSLSAGVFTINLTDTWHLAVVSAAAYLLKNLVTPSQTVIQGAAPGTTTTVTIPPPGQTVTK